RPGDAGADVAPVLVETGQARVHALRREREARREREHDRRVPEAEEEADAERALAVGEELPRRVVDRRDVVGVEGVSQPEGVGERAEPGGRGVGARGGGEEATAEDVEEEDGAGEPRAAAPRRAGP